MSSFVTTCSHVVGTLEIVVDIYRYNDLVVLVMYSVLVYA